jgi:hypothetical protein
LQCNEFIAYQALQPMGKRWRTDAGLEGFRWLSNWKDTVLPHLDGIPAFCFSLQGCWYDYCLIVVIQNNGSQQGVPDPAGMITGSRGGRASFIF